MECVDNNKQTNKKRCDCSVTQDAYVKALKPLKPVLVLMFMFLLQIMQENNVFC